MKSVCNKCGQVYKDLSAKSLRKMGVKHRVNYPFGTKETKNKVKVKTKGISTLFCRCGGILVEQ